jgi:DNA polymerase
VPRARPDPIPAPSRTLPIVDDAAFASPVLSTVEKVERLQQVASRVAACTLCTLCEQRTNTVPGEGNVDTLVMFVGEGPGETEDRTGRPFVGKAGELLEKQIAAMGLTREQVFIANVVKCRPPGNRTPTSSEVATCSPFLVEQIEIVRPRVIVALGLPATRFFLRDDKIAISRVRGTWHEWRGIRVMPTFHPAHLLRNYSTENRRAVWSDLQQVMSALGLPGMSRTQ